MGRHAPAFVALVDDARSRIREISVEGVRAWQEAERAFRFIDVREDREWEAGHCAGAEHLGKGVIERDIEGAVPDKGAAIVLYCGGGYRSALAGDALQQMGYRDVWSMAGGIRRWRELGLPQGQG